MSPSSPYKSSLPLPTRQPESTVQLLTTSMQHHPPTVQPLTTSMQHHPPTVQPLTTSTMQHHPPTVQPLTTFMQHHPPTVQPLTTSTMQHHPSTVQHSMPAWQKPQSRVRRQSKQDIPSPEQYMKMAIFDYQTIFLGPYFDSLLGCDGLRFRDVSDRMWCIDEIITGITAIIKQHNVIPEELRPLLHLRSFTIELARKKPSKGLCPKEGIARALIALLSTPLQVPGYRGQRSVIGYEDHGDTVTLMLDVAEEHKQHSIFYEEPELSWSQVSQMIEPHLHSIREHWQNQNQIIDNTNNAVDGTNKKTVDNTNNAVDGTNKKTVDNTNNAVDGTTKKTVDNTNNAVDGTNKKTVDNTNNAVDGTNKNNAVDGMKEIDGFVNVL